MTHHDLLMDTEIPSHWTDGPFAVLVALCLTVAAPFVVLGLFGFAFFRK